MGAEPIGVFQDVERPVYDEAMAEQLATAVGARGEGTWSNSSTLATPGRIS